MTTALIIIFGVLFAVCVICLLTGCAVAIADCFRKDSADDWLETQLAARRATHRAAARKIIPLVILLLLVSKCAAWSSEATPPVAASGAPSGTAEWLGVAAFIIATAVGLGNLIQMVRGTKLQQPITVAGQDKFATASAFSRHCDAQKDDLRRIEAHTSEVIEGVRTELHSLSREVSDMNGRSEINSKRLERLEVVLNDIHRNLPSQNRPR